MHISCLIKFILHSSFNGETENTDKPIEHGYKMFKNNYVAYKYAKNVHIKIIIKNVTIFLSFYDTFKACNNIFPSHSSGSYYEPYENIHSTKHSLSQLYMLKSSVIHFMK